MVAVGEEAIRQSGRRGGVELNMFVLAAGDLDRADGQADHGDDQRPHDQPGFLLRVALKRRQEHAGRRQEEEQGAEGLVGRQADGPPSIGQTDQGDGACKGLATGQRLPETGRQGRQLQQGQGGREGQDHERRQSEARVGQIRRPQQRRQERDHAEQFGDHQPDGI